ncbi:MAG: hypothetical protein CVV05_01105 [Gammaproteobacteria bacterium HGW-Gammaproteobacteria-1]|jgi:hypothetical protein|nr:MAG: hypothetical protein CVV05_01105 [Gammaproteobacteria bacterium HGW-Gammaproteobacteria-1]
MFSHEALLAGFVYDPRYDGPPLDPVHLDYRGAGQRSFNFRVADGLPVPFNYALPSPKSLDGLAYYYYPDLARMPETKVLHHLAHSENQGLRFERKTLVIGEETSYMLTNQPNRGFHGRVTAFKDIEATNPQTRCSTQFRVGHHTYNGLPHLVAQDPDGSEWLVHRQPKNNPAHGPRIGAVIFSALQHAGFDVPRHQLMTLGNGDSVLMVERQDVRAGQQLHTLPVSDLLPNSSGATYHQVVDLLRRSSANPETDIERLAEHLVADLVFNNIGNDSRYMQLVASGHGYRLGAMYARMAQVHAAPFMTQVRAHGSCSLSRAEDLDLLGLSTGIPASVIEGKAVNLAKVVVKDLFAIAESHHLSPEDWGVLRAAIAVHQPAFAADLRKTRPSQAVAAHMLRP